MVKTFVIILVGARIKDKRTRGIQIQLTEGRISVIDIHSHILDSLDGNVKTEEGSLKLLRFAVELGVTDIIATPCIKGSAGTFLLLPRDFSTTLGMTVR